MPADGEMGARLLLRVELGIGRLLHAVVLELITNGERREAGLVVLVLVADQAVACAEWNEDAFLDRAAQRCRDLPRRLRRINVTAASRIGCRCKRRGRAPRSSPSQLSETSAMNSATLSANRRGSASSSRSPIPAAGLGSEAEGTARASSASSSFFHEATGFRPSSARSSAASGALDRALQRSVAATIDRRWLR